MRNLIIILILLLLAPAAARDLSVPEFNESTRQAFQKGAAWTKSPLQVALRLVGDRHQSKERTISIKSTPERFNDAEVTITEEGLMDDSVRGIRFQLVLRKSELGYWVVESAKETFRCWPGRGHDDYSDKPCH